MSDPYELPFVTRPIEPFVMQMDEAAQETLRNARPYIAPPPPADIPFPEGYDDIRERVYSAINDARRWHLPLTGARLHLGREVYDDLLRQYAVPPTSFPPPIRYAGIDVVVEDGGSPTMIELRWSIRG